MQTPEIDFRGFLVQQVIHDAKPKKTFFLKQWRMPERECE